MSQSIWKNSASRGASHDAAAKLWMYGLFGGFLLLLIYPSQAIATVYVLFFLLPFIALSVFGIVGAVLGSLGCK